MRTQEEVKAMLTATQEEIARWDAEVIKAQASGDDGNYEEYCENILAELHTRHGLLKWILNE